MEQGMIDAILIRLLVVGFVLLAAGIFYNRWVMQHRQETRGFTSLLVAGGVAGTLAATLFVVWPLGPAAWGAVAICAVLFLVSGGPMIWGSIDRYVKGRDTQEQDVAQALRRLREE